MDDGSSDGSGAILDEYAAKDNRFRVIPQKNAGVSVARNNGLLRASGVYVTFVDGDDVIAADWLRTARKCLDKDRIDLLRMNLSYWKEGDAIPVVHNMYNIKFFNGYLDALVWGWDTLLRYGWCCVLFFRRVGTPIENGYGFVPGMRMREDNIFSIGALSWVNAAAQCDYAGYFYRQRKNSAVMRSYTKKDQELFRRHLRRLWKKTLHDIKKTGKYNELKSLYSEHMHMRMCPESRFNPFHIWRALKRRLFRE